MVRQCSWSNTSDSQSGDHGFGSRTDYMENEWIKSSECASGNCVEVKINSHIIEVRDAEGDMVMYTRNEWKAFIQGVKNNEFDI